MNIVEQIKKKIFIVAEIGNNHNGSINNAKKLVDVAVASGADAVKFQTFRGRDIVAPNVLADDYPGWDVKEYKYWYEFLDSIALPFDKHEEIFEYARKKNILPFSTPTSSSAVDLLETLNVQLYKIASMDVTNVQLLKKVASTGKYVIMSTGMAEEKEIDDAVNCFDPGKLILMHCISDYPLNYRNANLKTIIKLKNKYGIPVGFSDHSLGFNLSVMAIACGARIIEKHITLSRNSIKKAEHHFSLLPEEFRDFIIQIRDAEIALGSTKIVRSIQEKKFRLKARRSLHLNKNLRAADVLKTEDIDIVRPANGATPGSFDFFIGKKLKRYKKAWDPLNKGDVL